MSAVAFDTLKFVETLERAGVTREQASAIASAVRDSHDSADVATKGDLRELELRVRGEIAEVRSELKQHRWMLGTVLGGIVVLLNFHKIKSL